MERLLQFFYYALIHTPPSLPPSISSFIDECKECEWGTLNVGQQGEGRIAVSWMAIACETGGTPISYVMVVSREGRRGGRIRVN